MPKKATTKRTAPQAEPMQVPTVMGRPSSYMPEYTKVTAALCSHGATDQDLADYFAVTERTINRWKITHPEFLEACNTGKDQADDRVQRSLYHRAMEREIEEEQAIKVKKVTYGPDGKKLLEEEKVEIVTIKKTVPASDTAIIFWLKNRRRQDWRDVHQHEHGKPGDFDNMSLDELNTYIATGFAGLSEDDKQHILQLANARPQGKGKVATKH